MTIRFSMDQQMDGYPLPGLSLLYNCYTLRSTFYKEKMCTTYIVFKIKLGCFFVSLMLSKSMG